MKYKRKRRLQGMTAWALTLCLTVGMFGSLPVVAEQAPEAGAQLSEQKWTPDEEERQRLAMTAGDWTLNQLAQAELSEAETPEVISLSEAQAKEHVHRLREQEPDLNTVVFQNRDGTKTMYQYGSPVKYIDETGQVRDKRNTLGTDVKTAYAADYGYVNSQNDIRTYFPKNLSSSKGVLLENGDVKLELRPVQSVRRQASAAQAASMEQTQSPQAEPPSAAAGAGAGAREQQVTLAVAKAGEKKTLQAQAAAERDTQVMEYAGVFGTGTVLRYTPTFEGFKEDIILSSSSAGHEFVFEVDAGGLQAVAENGAIQFIDPLTGEIKAGMDPIYVYDSCTGERTQENPHDSYDNQLLCEPAEGGKYRVTIVADEDFLNDPDTVYPVYVDPTITVNTSGSGWTKTIEDAVVFSGQPYSNQNNNKYMHVGYVDTTYGVGRALIRFPGLRDNAAYNSLEDDQITSVKFYIYKTNDVNSTEDTIVGAYRYTGPGWTETDATYCSVDTSSFTDLQDEQVVYGTQQKYIGFDITEAAMLWRTSYTASNRGILLKNLNEYSRSYDRNFLSTRMGTNKPYVQVDYESSGLPAQPGIESGSIYHIKSNYSGYYLDVVNGATANGSGLQQTTFNGSAAQQFELCRDSYTGYYYISPQNAKNKYLILNTSNQVVLSDDCASSRALWRIKEESNGVYSFINRYTESNYGYTMAASGNACALSAAIIGEPYSTSAHFGWKLESVLEIDKNKAYWIRQKSTNNYLTATGWENNSAVSVKTANVDFDSITSMRQIQELNLYWQIKYDANAGGYRIIPMNSQQKQLKVLSENNTNGTSVGLYDKNSSDHSTWQIVKKGSSNNQDCYQILSRLDGTKRGLSLSGTNAIIQNVSLAAEWEIVEAECPYQEADSPKHAYGHALVRSGYSYRCCLCNATFKSPEEQDQYYLLERDYATVVALQRAYCEKMIQGNNQYAEAALRAMDIIRANSGAKYDFSKPNGDYFSIYNYTLDNLNCSIKINTDTINQSGEIASTMILDLVTMLAPFPYSELLSAISNIKDKLGYETISFSDLISVSGIILGLLGKKSETVELITTIIGINSMINYDPGYMYRYAFKTRVRFDDNVKPQLFTADYRFDYVNPIHVKSESLSEGQLVSNYASNIFTYIDNGFQRFSQQLT